MTPYDEWFIPIFLMGCLVAAIVSGVAGGMAGCVFPGTLLVVGVLAFWAATVFGADFGYRAWQSLPDPPAEAFSDASVMGAMLFGWFPGVLFCLAVFGLVRGTRWLLHWANPDAFPAVTKTAADSVKSGNPVSKD